eukprot:6932310-Alexandrium_andersonii.AAC.1
MVAGLRDPLRRFNKWHREQLDEVPRSRALDQKPRGMRRGRSRLRLAVGPRRRRDYGGPCCGVREAHEQPPPQSKRGAPSVGSGELGALAAVALSRRKGSYEAFMFFAGPIRVSPSRFGYAMRQAASREAYTALPFSAP